MKYLASVFILFGATSAFADSFPYFPKNHISLMCGIGPTSVDVKQENNQIIIKQKTSIVGGIEYERRFLNNKTIGVQVFSNSTYMVKLGFWF